MKKLYENWRSFQDDIDTEKQFQSNVIELLKDIAYTPEAGQLPEEIQLRILKFIRENDHIPAPDRTIHELRLRFMKEEQIDEQEMQKFLEFAEKTTENSDFDNYSLEELEKVAEALNNLTENDEFVLKEIEKFQKLVKRKHSRMKRRLIGRGKVSTSAGGSPYTKKPSFKRSKSAPAGAGGS